MKRASTEEESTPADAVVVKTEEKKKKKRRDRKKKKSKTSDGAADVTEGPATEQGNKLKDRLKSVLTPLASVKVPEPIAPLVVVAQSTPVNWLREQQIYHNFIPQSVEAHIMFLHMAIQELCKEMSGLTDQVTWPLREYKNAASRAIASDASPTDGRLPQIETLIEILGHVSKMHGKMVSFGKRLDENTKALLALHQNIQELASKSRARMRNVTAHTFNSIIFSANTPGSSLLSSSTVPQ